VTRILLVEDEESYRDPLTYQLTREGYEVVTAATGPDALVAWEDGGADLVLLDLMLPGMSGTEVCRWLRARSDVPVIMLTAKDGEIDKVVGLELGADDYVTKPYSFRELLARVRAVLRRGAIGAGDVGTEPVERHARRRPGPPGRRAAHGPRPR
jgi:two-component system response regulator RegX3